MGPNSCRQELAASIATEGLLPLMGPNTPQPLMALLQSCWKLDPAERPSAAQMLHSLKSMQADTGLKDSHAAANNIKATAGRPYGLRQPVIWDALPVLLSACTSVKTCSVQSLHRVRPTPCLLYCTFSTFWQSCLRPAEGRVGGKLPR